MMITCLGFDPGRDKCGIAVMNGDRLLYHTVILSEDVESKLPQLCADYDVQQVVMGDQTTAKQWYENLRGYLPAHIPLTFVNERNSTAEARERYWQLYPPQGLVRLVPLGLRTPPRPVDDIVAIVLIERYWASLKSGC